MDKVIVEGTGTTDLRQGPGHYDGTPLPGQIGNAAIAGHRTTYGAPFYNLNELADGDPIVVTTTQGVFTYSVTRSLIVPCGDSNCNDPADVAVIAPSTTPELTLTTCNPRFSSSSRLVVQATLTSASVSEVGRRHHADDGARGPSGFGEGDGRSGRRPRRLGAGGLVGRRCPGRRARRLAAGPAPAGIVDPVRGLRGRDGGGAPCSLLLLRRRQSAATRQLLRRTPPAATTPGSRSRRPADQMACWWASVSPP